MKRTIASTIVALILVATVLIGCTKLYELEPEELLPATSANLHEVMYVKLSAHPENPLFHQGERLNYVLVLENTQDKPLNFIFSGEKAEAYTWLSIREISPQKR